MTQNIATYLMIAATLLLFACSDPGIPLRANSADNSTVGNMTSIVDKNTEALGGETALDSVQTMLKRSLVIEGEYRDIAVFATDRLGRMRVDIFADGRRVFAESFDGEKAYQWNEQDGQSAASERGTAALSHTPQLPNHIFRLKDLVANGHHLKLSGLETVNGTEFAVLKLTLSDGFENYLWVDSKSGFVTRVRNTRALHVDIDDSEKVIESRISDFRRVGGIVHPHRVEEVDLKSGEVLVEVSLLSLELNTEIPDSYFSDLARQVPNPE